MVVIIRIFKLQLPINNNLVETDIGGDGVVLLLP
jgi:hypothetical protein